MPETRTRYEWSEGFDLAMALVKRHPDLLKDTPPLSDVLFVMDKESRPKKQGHPVLARVSKIPAKFDDFVVEGDKTWMLEWFYLNQVDATRNQQTLIMFHELLHFTDGGDQTRDHDIADFRVIVERFGYNWAEQTHGDVADILDPDFTWGKRGQSRLDLTGDVPTLEFATVKEASDTLRQVAEKPAPTDWQPSGPYVAPDNVIPFPTAKTGTESD